MYLVWKNSRQFLHLAYPRSRKTTDAILVLSGIDWSILDKYQFKFFTYSFDFEIQVRNFVVSGTFTLSVYIGSNYLLAGVYNMSLIIVFMEVYKQ